MSALTLFFRNGDTFVLGGELDSLSAFYEDLINGDSTFIELTEGLGARLSVRRKDVSSMMLDPGADSNALFLSPIIRMQVQLSGHELNQLTIKGQMNAEVAARQGGPEESNSV